MALDYDYLMSLPPIETRHVFRVRDTILYALGVGAGLDAPTDPHELQFVYEEGLKALPTMAVVLAYPGFWAKDPKYGLDWRRVLHGEQSIELHRPLPVAGELRGLTTIDAIFDKGADKGAVLYSSRRIEDVASGELVATVRQSSFLRGDGGFGGRSEGAPKPHPIPERAPDMVLQMKTRPEQALIYRLSGDYNPLHIDPEVARQAGFGAPILHGLASYGVAGRAVLRALTGGDPGRLRRYDVRFSSPVFPGETLEVALWREGPGRGALAARVVERDVRVLQNGYVEFSE
ncbi:MAG: MaoC/PaaZ C-terminal domain-containing protein [Parcubacteria group bacterium]